MTTTELSKKLKNNPKGVYLFYGEEEYLKRRYLEQFRQTLIGNDAAAAFNHVKIEGGDLSRLSVEIDSLPLLTGCFGGTADSQGNRLIEVWDTDFSKMKSDTLKQLCELLEGVSDLTVIFYTASEEFPTGTSKKPSTQLSALQKCASCVNFERQKPQMLAAWVARHASANGCFLTTELCRKLIDYCSADMYILSREVEKLCAYILAHGRSKAEEVDILTVCSPTAVYGAFDFVNALLDHKTAKAFILLEDMKKRKEKPQDILGTVSKLCSELLQVKVLRDCGLSSTEIASKLKMHEYVLSLRLKSASARSIEALEKAVTLCRNADRKIKSTRLDSFRVIELLILEMG